MDKETLMSNYLSKINRLRGPFDSFINTNKSFNHISEQELCWVIIYMVFK